MGAPGIEAGNPVVTVVYCGLLKATVTTHLRELQPTTHYYVLLRPPTYEPDFCHPYKCPAGQL
jgi:hypothetical protein